MIVNVFFTVLALVAVFLFSIKKFSNQMERVAGDRFKHIVRTLTSTPLRGTLIGTVVTALLHSSTATTVMTVGLVNAGIISFYNSLGIVFGANIGTTLTLQLVALKLTSIAPYIVLVGFLLDVVGKKRYGKPIFYFGMVFFCLALISQFVAPLQSDPFVVSLFSQITSVGVALFVGVIVTVMFQSSTIVSGLVLILAANGLLQFDQALGIIFGANIGTTSTSLIASVSMDHAAKKTALAHFLFNLISVIIFLPFIPEYASFIKWIGGDIGMQIANAQVIFNIVGTIIFLIAIKPFAKLIELLVPHKQV